MSILGHGIGFDLDTINLGARVDDINQSRRSNRGDEERVPNLHALKWEDPFRLRETLILILQSVSPSAL